MNDKRFTAAMIDYGIVFIAMTVLSFLPMPSWFWGFGFQIGKVPISLGSLGAYLLIGSICLKDLLFKNASLGKRIMGLILVNDAWEKPSLKQMLIRGVAMPLLGLLHFISAKGDLKKLAVWEKGTLHTRIVPKALFEELKGIAEGKAGPYAENMEILYQKRMEERE